MKHLWVRFMTALSLCLFTVTAFAADVVTDVSQGPIQHPVLAIAATLSAALTRMLQGDVSWFPTRLAPFRLLAILGLSAGGSWIDMVQHGTSYSQAFFAALITAIPSLVIELAHLAGGGPGAGKPASSDVDAKSAQPTPYSNPPGTNTVKVEISIAPNRDPSRIAQAVADQFSKLRRFPVAVAALVVALAVLPGCASIPKILTVISDVTSIVQEAQSLAASARDEESQYFLRHPNADAQAKVEQALSDVEQSLAAFSRASKGVTEASLGQLDSAQADFVLAWKKLEGVLRDLGVMHGNKIAASPGAAPTEIREPLLLTAKLHS